MKEQPGFEGFKFNFDDFFGDFGGFGNRHSHGERNSREGGGGFRFTFDNMFGGQNGHDDDDDDDGMFSAANHGFGNDGGFGFGDDIFSFGSHESTFTKTEKRSSGNSSLKEIIYC